MSLYYIVYLSLLTIPFCHQTHINCFYEDPNLDTRSIKEVITNPPQSDGFGSQFQVIIASVIYAELNNKKFVYTPFQRMEHNYTHDNDFIAKKEHLINFIGNFELNKNHTNHSYINYKLHFDANVVAYANSLSLKKIKQIFRANKNINRYFNNDNLNIVVHIRRPNSHDNRIEGTDTSDTIFLNIINKLRIMYASKNPLFHIHSQGKIEGFTQFKAPDVVLHLNKSTEESFTAMVLADVLVTGTSSFSYTAGLLSEGIVYYVPFWHAALPSWIPINQL